MKCIKREAMMQQKLNREYMLVEENIFTTFKDTLGSAYDRKARAYEKLVSSTLYNKIIWGTLPKDYTDFARKVISISTGASIDIGCGGLVQTSTIYSKSTQNFILLDNSIEMLKIAKKRLMSYSDKFPKNIELLQSNAFDLPFQNETFDNVFSFGLIHCFENKQEFINEVLRILKVNGKFYFTSMTSDRFISKCYMSLLRQQKEFGEPLTSKQTMNMFDNSALEVEYCMKGSMIFINGTKKI